MDESSLIYSFVENSWDGGGGKEPLLFRDSFVHIRIKLLVHDVICCSNFKILSSFVMLSSAQFIRKVIQFL